MNILATVVVTVFIFYQKKTTTNDNYKAIYIWLLTYKSSDDTQQTYLQKIIIVFINVETMLNQNGILNKTRADPGDIVFKKPIARYVIFHNISYLIHLSIILRYTNNQVDLVQQQNSLFRLMIYLRFMHTQLPTHQYGSQISRILISREKREKN